MILTRSFWPADTSEGIAAVTVGDLLRDAAADAPELIALIAGRVDPAERRSWSYAELLTEAEQAARALLEHMAPGERAAIVAPNVPEWMILELGAALAGVELVAINPAIADADLLDALARSRTAVLFHLAQAGDRDRVAVVRRNRPRLPRLRETIAFSAWTDFVGGADPGRPLPRVSPEATADILFTSGTAGAPIGVVTRHEALTNNARFAFRRMGLRRGERVLPAVPLCHGSSCGFCVLGSLAQRATLVLPEVLDPGHVLELAATCRAQLLFTLPARLTGMVEHPAARRHDLSAMRIVVSAAAPSGPALIRSVGSSFGCPVVNVYGQTEASAIAVSAPTDGTHATADAIGRPLPQAECKVIDPLTGQITDVGAPGELCVRGYQVMSEYLEAPAITANRIDPQGWLHTTDVVTLDERGNITVTGRLNDVIVQGTERIFPREIENCLHGHPGVGDAIVLGIPDGRGDQRIVAVVRPVAGSSAAPAELRTHCLRQLGPVRTPTSWYFVDRIPLTGPGKIRKHALRASILDGRLKPEPAVVPRRGTGRE